MFTTRCNGPQHRGLHTAAFTATRQHGTLRTRQSSAGYACISVDMCTHSSPWPLARTLVSLSSRTMGDSSPRTHLLRCLFDAADAVASMKLLHHDEATDCSGRWPSARGSGIPGILERMAGRPGPAGCRGLARNRSACRSMPITITSAQASSRLVDSQVDSQVLLVPPWRTTPPLALRPPPVAELSLPANL